MRQGENDDETHSEQGRQERLMRIHRDVRDKPRFKAGKNFVDVSDNSDMRTQQNSPTQAGLNTENACFFLFATISLLPATPINLKVEDKKQC
jgi:hypothetical protein